MRQVTFLFVCVALMAAGCGASAEPATVTVTKTVTSDVANEAVVHIYFCTTDTCAKDVTQAQIKAASRRALASPLVERVVFVSKEHALEAMKKKHPEEVQALPSNPFPDELTVVPNNPEDVEQVAALFSASPAIGIDKIDYARPG